MSSFAGKCAVGRPLHGTDAATRCQQRGRLALPEDLAAYYASAWSKGVKCSAPAWASSKRRKTGSPQAASMGAARSGGTTGISLKTTMGRPSICARQKRLTSSPQCLSCCVRCNHASATKARLSSQRGLLRKARVTTAVGGWQQKT